MCGGRRVAAADFAVAPITFAAAATAKIPLQVGRFVAVKSCQPARAMRIVAIRAVPLLLRLAVPAEDAPIDLRRRCVPFNENRHWAARREGAARNGAAAALAEVDRRRGGKAEGAGLGARSMRGG